MNTRPVTRVGEHSRSPRQVVQSIFPASHIYLIVKLNVYGNGASAESTPTRRSNNVCIVKQHTSHQALTSRSKEVRIKSYTDRMMISENLFVF